MYCAHPDGEHCVPQVCVPGASPPPYEPNWWVRLFYALGGLQHFPPPDDLMENYMDYAWILARPSLALLEIGLFAAVSTTVCVCCCRGFGILHLRLGDKGKPVPLRQRPADGGGTDPEEDGPGQDGGPDAPEKPWACPLLCVALFILCFNWAAIKIRHRGFSRDVETIGSQVMHAYQDIKVVADQAAIVNKTCADFKNDLLQVPLSCKVDDPITQALIKKGTHMADEALANYVHQVQQLYQAVRKLPFYIEVIAYLFVNNIQAIIWVPLIPTLLVSIICLLILIEAIAARCFNSSMLADCVDCGLKVASILFFLVIVVVAAIAAVELAACVTASVFCMHVDENSLEYIQMAVGGNETDPYSDAYNASRYYVRGDMYNPIVGYAEAADKYITQVVDIYKDVEDQISMVGKFCPGINDINVEAIGAEAESILGHVRRILNGTNVYPYYEGIVRNGACQRIVASLGWIVLFQIVMGIVLFPVCILVAHFFLVRFATWKHFVDDDRGSSDSEEDSDGEEDEDSGKADEDLPLKDAKLEQGEADKPARGNQVAPAEGGSRAAPAAAPQGAKQPQDSGYGRADAGYGRADPSYSRLAAPGSSRPDSGYSRPDPSYGRPTPPSYNRSDRYG